MKLARIAAVAKPYVAVAGTFFLAAALLGTISITTFDRQWIVFLGGVLSAAILAFVSYNSNSRWIIARRTSQLKAARAKLATEVRLRAHSEQALARVRNNVELVDHALPAMLAYVDGGGRVRYHNHSYKRWVGLEDKSIDGKRVEEIIGSEAYGQIEKHLSDAMQGHDVRYERTQTMLNGETCRLNVQYLPHYGDSGKVAGVFAILTDITRAVDLGGTAQEMPEPEDPEMPENPADDVAARLISALEHDEFSLHCQEIVALGRGAPRASFHEVLLRMNEEEEYHLPPGTFLPLAEQLGLLHEIDRWVVRHVVDFAAAAGPQVNAVYFVNLSVQTLLDPQFAQFVRDRLEERGVPGHVLCFELSEAVALAKSAAQRELIAALDGTGCRFAVSGFGCNPLFLRFFRQLRVDFLKLDCGIVLNMLSSPGGLARVKAVNQAAHAAGMRTVAECVESEATRAALEGIGTDFAQGFGIARPRLMSSLGDGDTLRNPPPGLQKAAA